MKKDYDLVVIGGGPAGTPVAMEYAKLREDKSVLLVDKYGHLGGECLFDGCIPSKIMEATAQEIAGLQKLKEFGVELCDEHYRLVWHKVKERKKEILSQRSAAAEENLGTLPNVTIHKAEALFVGRDTIKLSSGEEVKFDKAVIATGAKAFVPHYEGSGADKIWTNNDFFEKMPFPKSMAIIGDGAIAIEFAQILSRLGVKISLFGRHTGILKHVDREFSEILRETMQANENIELILNSDITEVNFEQNFEVVYTQERIQKKKEFEIVMAATGRVANIENLGLDLCGVVYTKAGIETDKHLQTTNENIYANGDLVQNFPKFAHTAQYGAHTIAQNLFLEHNIFSIDFDKNSWVLFSSPNIATAGLSEEEAKKRGLDVIVGVYDYGIDAKAQIEQEFGYLKYIVEKKSKKIVGVTMIHKDANALIGEAALIVAQGLKLSDLVSTIHPHPTLSEAYGVLAKMMMGELMQEKLKKPVVKVLLEIERFL